jgi:hypothetical protein
MTDEIAEKNGIMFNLEYDANEAASHFLGNQGRLQFWSPFGYKWYLWIGAKFCAATKLELFVLCVTEIWMFVALLFVVPHYAPFVGIIVSVIVACIYLFSQLLKELS